MRIINFFFFEGILFSVLLAVQFIYLFVSYEIKYDFTELAYLFFLETLIFALYIIVKIFITYRFRKSYKKESKSKLHGFYSDIITELEGDIKEKEMSESDLIRKHSDNTDIIYGFVHELKTPLTSLKLLTDDNSECRNEIFRIEECINELLFYTKISDLSSDLQFSKISIDELLKDLVKRYRIFFITKKIKLNLEEGGIEIYTDYKWLFFALSQILNNSLKYTPLKGKIDVLFRYESEHPELVIRDNGPGISAENIHRIFDRGFSTDHRSVSYKGTGLGLYNAKKVLNALNVKVSVESVLNDYTEFTFLFRGNSDFMIKNN